MPVHHFFPTWQRSQNRIKHLSIVWYKNFIIESDLYWSRNNWSAFKNLLVTSLSFIILFWFKLLHSREISKTIWIVKRLAPLKWTKLQVAYLDTRKPQMHVEPTRGGWREMETRFSFCVDLRLCSTWSVDRWSYVISFGSLSGSKVLKVKQSV